MNKQKLYLIFIILISLFFNSESVVAQNDVMMQGFNFYVPVDIKNRNGTWWDNLAGKSQDIKEAGFTGIWTPPPSKARASP